MRTLRTLFRALGDWLMATIWSMLLAASLILPLWWAAANIIAVLSLMTWIFVLRPTGRARRLATLRLRPIGPATGWIIAAVLPCLMFLLGFDLLYVTVVSTPPAPHKEIAQAGASMIPPLVAVTVAGPMIEEAMFRGWMQSRIQRRQGARTALLLTALLFALGHSPFDVFPIRFLTGLLFGYVVVTTRSLWAGILLHIGWNSIASFAALAARTFGDPQAGSQDIPLVIPLVLLAVSAPAMWFTLAAARKAQRRAFDANGSSPPAARLHLSAR